MPIIIVSSDSPDREKEIAEKVAEELGYDLLGPPFLTDVASRRQIPPGKFEEALARRPAILRKVTSRQRCFHLACIQAEVLDRFQSDNTVCWGLAAHLYIFNISHVLKVRILSPGNAANEKNRQRKWSMETFGHDETDPSLFDLVINLDQIDSGEAIETIAGAVTYRKFQPMTYSVKCLSDQTLAARARAELVKSMGPLDIQAQDGVVIVLTRAFNWEKRKKTQAIKEAVGKIDGVMHVEVHFQTPLASGGKENAN